MSIVSKRGDDGNSDLLFGVRVPKTDPRLEAIGAVDELNAALGVVRASTSESELVGLIDRLQEKLVGLMGELAIRPDDTGRYAKSGFPSIADDDVAMLESEATAIEGEGISFDGWARPGANGNLTGAHLDLARAIARRAERRVLALGHSVANPSIPIFLNRLSDVLWLLARKTEQG